MKAELIFWNRSALLEGPNWCEKRGELSFVAIRGCSIFRMNVHTGRIWTYETAGPVGAAVPDRDGSFLEAEKGGIYRLDPLSGVKTFLAHVITDPAMRYNDAILDGKGRLLVDVMGDTERNSRGGMFSVAPDGSFQQLIFGTTVANGMGFSPDQKKLYFIDSPTRQVVAYAYDPEQGTLLSGPETVVQIMDGSSPDGMCVNEEGLLWVAQYGGSKVSLWNPQTHSQLAEIELPCRSVTSCCLGGEKKHTLFITTASSKEDTYPYGGGLFMANW